MNKITAIILAAGSGSRMNSSIKKQFIEIKGKPIIWYSLFTFQNSLVDDIILVTGKEDIEYIEKEIVNANHFSKVKAIVTGGVERYESVFNGLQKVSDGIVLIHDAARPLIDQDIINRCIEGATKYQAVVAGMPVKDTIKIIGDDNIIEETPNRNKLWLTQTPQAFCVNLLKTAYNNMMKDIPEGITDDAMVVEKYTEQKVRFVYGNYSNIKVTTPEDIGLVETLLK